PRTAPPLPSPEPVSVYLATNTSLTGTGGMDVFVAKYTDTGSGLGNGGAVRGGGSANDQGQALTISGTNIYVGGTFNGTASLAGSSLTSASTTLPDIFVAKYADTGSGLSSTFAVRDGGTNTEAVGGILVSSGSVYVAGAYTGTTTLAGTTMTSSSDDGFVAKYTDGTSTLTGTGAIHNGATAAGASVSANTTLAVSNGQVYVGGLVATPATFTSATTLTASSGSAFAAKLAPNTATVVSITGITPSPTATTQVTYQVVFSGAVTGLGISNFDLTTTGISGATIVSVSGSGTTYTVTVNTGTGTSNGTLRLNVQNSTGTSPTITGLPATTGTTYTITKSFAAAPQLTIVGTGGTGSDVTAFVDQVQVLSSSTAFANGLQNGSFETHGALANGNFGYNPGGASWTFNAQSGIAESGSAFTPVTPIPNGIAVAFVQSLNGNNGQLQQNLAVPTGTSYQVSFQAAQRVCCTTLDQALNVFLNGVYLGTIRPVDGNGYSTFASPTFAVTAPALTATVSTTAGSPTSTSPIPFAVSFSQSVGTTFTASDVTVTGGTLNTSSFSGSGSGPYTFTVTPTGSGTVTVSLVANVANDANNTGNTASNAVSVQYAQPSTAAPVVTAPANGSFVTATTTPAYTGTAPANSTVTVYVDNAAIGTTTALAGGGWSLTQPSALTQGSHTVYATAQTSGSSVSVNSNTNTFTVDTMRPTVVLTSSSGASGSTNVPAPFAFTATFSENVTGFIAGDLTVTNGTVTNFVAVSGTVYTFSVTPVTPNTVTTVTVAVNSSQDAAGNTNLASNTYSLTSPPPVVTVAPATLPNGMVGAAYSQTITASGATAPYTYAITAGALPAGLTLTSGGVLAGTPTAGGSFTFSVTATDASATPGPYSGSRSYTLSIVAPTIAVAPATLPNGTVGTAYSQTITAAGGTAPYSYAITAGALPSGLTLSASGILSGTPTTPGSFTFTVTATDASTGSGPYSGSLSYTLAIAGPASVTWNGTIST
ncbi:MAG: hypothetical protein EOO36_09775, partial [Cytophagaceae bacterium]